MKKSLIALTVLAAGAASAQSSVTLFGVVDAAVQVGKGTTADRTALGNGGLSSSRLGFRGTEDLGGGLSASFWLEAGLNNDDGRGSATNTNNQASGGAVAGIGGGQGLTFNRRSTVSLAGGWGEVRLGRDYTPQYMSLNVFDPFGAIGLGASQAYTSSITGVTNTRASNSIGYFLPRNLGGFYGQFQYHLGENASSVGATRDDGDGYGIRVGYAAGPFDVALTTSSVEAATGTIKHNNLGAQWDFGMLKLMGHVSRESIAGADGDGWLLGATAPVGSGLVRAAFSQYKRDNAVGADPKSRKISLGYVHNLSKRTALYATYARVRNSGGATAALNGSTTAANASSSGYEFGMRHSF